MSTIEVKFSIPEPLATSEAKESGLLEPETLQNILRAEIRRRQVDRLFETKARLVAAAVALRDIVQRQLTKNA